MRHWAETWAIEQVPAVTESPSQVVNDLLDPGRPALRLREDRRRGSHVEGAHEETLLDADHALALIAAGDANRKVLRAESETKLCDCPVKRDTGRQASAWRDDLQQMV